MEQKLLVKRGLFLKNPEEEKKLARELVVSVEDAFSSMFIPTVAFNENKIKINLRRAKEILGRFS